MKFVSVAMDFAIATDFAMDFAIAMDFAMDSVNNFVSRSWKMSERTNNFDQPASYSRMKTVTVRSIQESQQSFHLDYSLIS